MNNIAPNIARVFPRKTNASPTDALSFFGPPPMFLPDISEVHVSVAFTYDIPHAEFLAAQWQGIAPVKIGGPAYNNPGDLFQPGKYLKPGYVITSRGCPNKCWFCSVWKREPRLLELPIENGWNVLDDNLLACSEKHIRSVFDMLGRQKVRAEFTGGIEAKRLQKWHVDLFANIKPKRVFFAYDEEADWEPLEQASKLIWSAGFKPSSHSFRCYVLSGYPGDSIDAAEQRCRRACTIGLMPMVMIYRDKEGRRDQKWIQWGWRWSRPACIGAMCGGPVKSA
jgi:hypothetical protein